MSAVRKKAGDMCRRTSRHRGRRLFTSHEVDEPTSLIGIYRSENAHHVQRVVSPALVEGWTVAWWALDEVAPSLAGITVGHGPGAKFTLLNEVLVRSPSPVGWLVVADDDVEFVTGSPAELVAACEVAGFGLAQPAHVAASEVSHEITLSRALAIARRTNFVEIGPLFAVAPTYRGAVVPFTQHDGMGWGLELEWSELGERGCRLGIVDTVTIRHLGVVGAAYDRELEKQLLEERLRERGIEEWSESQQTLETWRPWQRRPPWHDRSAA